MTAIKRKLTTHRAERKAEQRRRAIMLDMMRELREMAQNGLLTPPQPDR